MVRHSFATSKRFSFYREFQKYRKSTSRRTFNDLTLEHKSFENFNETPGLRSNIADQRTPGNETRTLDGKRQQSPRRHCGQMIRGYSLQHIEKEPFSLFTLCPFSCMQLELDASVSALIAALMLVSEKCRLLS